MLAQVCFCGTGKTPDQRAHGDKLPPASFLLGGWELAVLTANGLRAFQVQLEPWY